MELINQNREFIKGAIAMCLFNEQQGSYYPKEPFTYNVIKEGTNWEAQFIYTVEVGDMPFGDGDWRATEKTDSVKVELPNDCNIEQLWGEVCYCLQIICENEYVR